jgi:hypothetical protein
MGGTLKDQWRRSEEDMIRFQFDGLTYEASMSFYDTNEFTLPDGRVLCATGWFETSPPKPTGLRVKGVDAVVAPATVLKAMLVAYDAAWLERVDACAREGTAAEWDTRAGNLAASLQGLRSAYVSAARGGTSFNLPDALRADYEARLRGNRPLDAAPEVGR